MSKRKHFLTMGKLMGFYGLMFIGLFLWDAGFDAAHHHYFQMAVDFVIVMFGLGFIAIMWMESLDDAERRMRDWYVDDAKGKLDEIFAQAKEFANRSHPILSPEIEHDIELAQAIAKDVLKGEKRAATADEVLIIQNAYHDQSDGKYCKVHSSSEAGIEIEISTEPIDDPADSTLRHAAAAERGDKARATQIPVQDGDAAPKPLTKSQQRRKNTKLGIGPITDDEVRENKNAKRRAARAAKKAELEQTKLV